MPASTRCPPRAAALLVVALAALAAAEPGRAPERAGVLTTGVDPGGGQVRLGALQASTWRLSAADAPPPQPPVVVSAPGGVVQQAPAPPPAAPPPRRIGIIAALASGAVGLGLGAALYGMTQGQLAAAQQIPQTMGAEYQAAINGTHAPLIASYAWMGAGGATLLGGLIALLVSLAG